VTVFLSIGLCLSPLISTKIVQAESPPTITTFAGFNIPYAICFDGANIWVTNRYISTVIKLRVSDGMVVGTYNVGSEPMGICFDGANIWVTNSGSNNVTKLRASDGTILGIYNTDTPWGICPDGSSIWIANRYSNTVSKLRASDGTVLGIYNVGSEPWGICSDGSSIWVANWGSNNVTKLRASDGAILGTYDVGTQPTGICFAGSSVWVANYGSNNVTKLRASDGSTIGTYSVGSNSHYISFDGTNIWVANYGSNNVTKLRASDGKVIDTYDISTPVGICFDGTNIWVTNYNGATVSKLYEIPASESSTKASEPPPKIDRTSAPRIPPNVLPIIIIACVIGLVIFLLIRLPKWRIRKRDELFERVYNAIDKYKPPPNTPRFEEAYQWALHQYLRTEFPSNKVELEKRMQNGGGRPDIVILPHIGVEVKGPTRDEHLDRLITQSWKYGKQFKKIIFVLFAPEFSERKFIPIRKKIEEDASRERPKIDVRFIRK
jgi:hypothetical protein